MKRHKHPSKWFGSLANLSIRLPSTRQKAAPEHHGSRARSADDIQSGPQQGGYVRSSDMYTHVGTVPRGERHQWNCRGMKQTSTKTTGDEEERGGGWRRAGAGEHVRDSPLLSALSSLSLNSADRPASASAATRPLPATPRLSRPSPLTSDSSSSDPWWVAARSQDAEGAPATAPSIVPKSPAQDVYVPMDPISDAAHRHMHEPGLTCTQDTTKEEADVHSQCGAAESSGEYVKFSKDKFWLEPPSENLKKQLEEELKLNSSNLRSHAWYHGPIPSEVSESLPLTHGDFLIRNSDSSRGDFVLTSHWDQKTTHVPIRKTVVHSSDTCTRVQYSLDQVVFDSLPALVRFYVGGRTVLTRWSPAQIHQPVNRTLPLSFLETVFGATVDPSPSQISLKDHSKDEVCSKSSSSLDHQDCDHPALCPDKDTRLPADNGVEESSRTGSWDEGLSITPPISAPAERVEAGQAGVPLDADGSCYTELYTGPQSFVKRLCAEEGVVQDVYSPPVVETVSSFRPGRYRSALMPSENKPLEVGVLQRVKALLAEVDPKTAAQHITKCDCTVGRILEVLPEVQKMMGVSSGMELLTLPHGQQLRLDLLERLQTMATMLAVNVLGCTGTTEERAGLLHRMIWTAAELKSNMGNMFGFVAVMRALELPQVTRLEQTWTALRQQHTEGAILYEKTLRPFMKNLNEGRESCPLSNTSFPHVLPLLHLLEKSVAVGEGAEPWETVEAGVDVVMFHLEEARTIAQWGDVYRSNAESKLQGLQEQADISEVFQTDFQMRLLWGSRGAVESQALRYAKFEQVLTALSNRLEPPTRPR
ncbi:SH2 domain containing 3Cb isoform X2 [Dunckerocampus dactyliophorus]|uniref:SH2 domain containing 3Cb isoform X2 n=1 Tax=Dunckerocampus dactyliophorus TaxID=161453 RepID=UPI00240677F1|nr:SH2 domain containing 3Cb isoform X2 [Dunckerocampus dactyliophorus]